MPDSNPTQSAPSSSSSSSKKEDLSTARLGSIAVECNQLKDDYEQCFFEFFPRFLYGEKFKEDPCAAQLKSYRDCLRAHLAGKMHIDLDALDAEKISTADLANAMAEGTNAKP
ncbi:unnamed protein product [Mesocestoides corti]|uniref:CHCH domain-containing protein n=1 Tax=Mesocestoides corti TaxID=53468 RepID=A0A0R3UPQ6_MESCO|nr:unnamed protein product [Mesocestoides corti]